MSIWIVTIGNNDVQLIEKNKWYDIRDKIKQTNKNSILTRQKFEQIKNSVEPAIIKKPNSENTFAIPARMLGLGVCDRQKLDNYYQYLVFPLLDSLSTQLREDSPHKIFYILTDQTSYFQDKKEELQYESCPYWKDTVTLQTILEEYFFHKFPQATILPEILKTKTDGKGLDDWDSTLDIVRDKIKEIAPETENSPEIKNSPETIYVSHQAGTPAISSAIQFSTLTKFGNRVKFLVSNEFTNIATSLEGSSYLDKIQMKQAEKLLEKGIPGATLEILKEIGNKTEYNNIKELIQQTQSYVDRFNIKANIEATETESDTKTNEFDPEKAIARIRDSLDLIEIFFEQENYLQGIILLSAAHETFVKAVIRKYIKSIDFKIAETNTGKPINLSDWIVWNENGLLFRGSKELNSLDFEKFCDSEINLEEELNFPVPTEEEQKKCNQNYCPDGNFNKIIHKPKERPIQFKIKNLKQKKRSYYNLENCRMLKWLHNLENFQDWKLLEWSFTPNRDNNIDLRNQFVHSLRGVEKKDVLKYLYGYKEDETTINLEELKVDEVYLEEVKKPFIKTLHKLNLISNDSPDNILKDKLKELAKDLI